MAFKEDHSCCYVENRLVTNEKITHNSLEEMMPEGFMKYLDQEKSVLDNLGRCDIELRRSKLRMVITKIMGSVVNVLRMRHL